MTIEEKMKELLNDSRTGLKDSSDTNKTRYGLLALLNEARSDERKRIREAVEKLKRYDPWAYGYNIDMTNGCNKALNDVLGLLNS